VGSALELSSAVCCWREAAEAEEVLVVGDRGHSSSLSSSSSAVLNSITTPPTIRVGRAGGTAEADASLCLRSSAGPADHVGAPPALTTARVAAEVSASKNVQL
jgi:hypothetical protein